MTSLRISQTQTFLHLIFIGSAVFHEVYAKPLVGVETYGVEGTGYNNVTNKRTRTHAARPPIDSASATTDIITEDPTATASSPQQDPNTYFPEEMQQDAVPMYGVLKRYILNCYMNL